MPKLALKPSPSIKPTDEQEHILKLLHDTPSNIIINALAGSGKTSTLELIQDAAPPPVLCLAFNRRIANEMEKRFKSTTTVRTFNSLGHRIWAGACSGKVVLDPKKTQELLREAIRDLPKTSQSEAYAEFWDIVAAINYAKSVGYIPAGTARFDHRLIGPEFADALDDPLSELGTDLLDDTLIASIKASYAGSIDYNDQIYMPALFGGTFPRFPLVLIDEAQDLSPTNHAMLEKLTRSRLVAVGDPWQSIYAFRGAVTGGMARLKERFEMTEADLTVSFRCPEVIVRAVHWHVPKMRWIKEGGRAIRIRNPSVASFTDGSAIICRNNAPLFALALRLLSNGRSVSVAGSDIGPRVIGIMRKLGDESMSRAAVAQAIEDWLAERLAKQSSTAPDIADCMRVFASFGETLGQAIRYAEHLFAQQGTIQLLTGHKAKGLEFEKVFHLDPWLIGEGEQELNLRYVISTRAMSELYEIDSREIRWT